MTKKTVLLYYNNYTYREAFELARSKCNKYVKIRFKWSPFSFWVHSDRVVEL